MSKVITEMSTETISIDQQLRIPDDRVGSAQATEREERIAAQRFRGGKREKLPYNAPGTQVWTVIVSSQIPNASLGLCSRIWIAM